MKKLPLLLTACLTLFILSAARAQDFSNKGKDFWLAYPAHVDGNTSRMALYISSDVSTTGTVFLGGMTIPFSVTANQASVVQISPGTYPVLNSQDDAPPANKGIHIVAQAPIVVYAHILNAARSGSSMILPTNTLGKEYIVASFKSSGNSGGGGANGSPAGSQFAIVAVSDNTVVEITPTVVNTTGSRPANLTYTVSLNQGQVYQLRSAFNNDLTGTRIRSLSTTGESCKPIAVFSGSAWTSMECNSASGGDNLFQQLMPKSAWGKNYVTAPFADRQYDIFRVIVSDPTTVVMKDGSQLMGLQGNTYYQFNSSSGSVITADKPVMVVQYLISQTCDTRNPSGCGGGGNPACPYPGDPEMVIINPIEQTVNDVTVVSARNNLTPPNTNISKHFFTIIMKDNAKSTLRIDGALPSGTFTPIGSSGYSYLHENVTASTNINPSHRIKADSGFIALAYGLGQVESYGYNAGTNIRDLYQFVSIRNQYATVDFPATCKGAPFFFSMTFPYQPTQIKWQFGGLFPDTTINSPVYDSTWSINGRALYKYKLPGSYSTNNLGTYQIKVLAQNPTPDGCSGEQEIIYDLEVIEQPVANFSFNNNGCVSDSVKFTDMTNTFGRTINSWQWDFADGGSSTGKDPAHLYTGPGSYQVKMRAITDIGCISNEASQTVVLSQPPVAKFGVSSPSCLGKNIIFTDSSTTPASSIIRWYWNFGDGTAPVSATTNAPQTHTYTALGTFEATLTVETTSGCKSLVFKKQVVISPNPVPSFSFGNACLPGGAMQFTNTSTISDGSEASFTNNWNFGDGGIGSGANPTHNYSTTGPFSVKLTVTSNAGCTENTVKDLNTVYAQPQAIFTIPAEICLGASIAPQESSTAPASSIVQWNWTFDDGTTSNVKDPVKTFATAGLHRVTLKVTSAVGCPSTVTEQTVLVNPVPSARFKLSSATQCETKDIGFTDQSAVSPGAISKWNWNMGDGAPVAVKTSAAPFNYVYASWGSYQVTLQTETDKGCISPLFDTTILVHPQPVPGFAMSENCLVDPYSEFTDTSSIADGTEAGFTYLWNFDDPAATGSNPNTATSKVPRHKYSSATDYDVQLTVTSGHGCVASITQSFTINGSLPQASFDISGGGTNCSNDSVTLVNHSFADVGGIVRLEIYWDQLNDPSAKEEDQFPSAGKIYKHRYPEFFTPSSKNYTIRMVAYSGDACMKDTLVTIEVLATPELNLSTIEDICANEAAVTLNQGTVLNAVGGTGLYTGPGVSATGIFDPAVAGPGTHTIRYTHTGGNGCSNFKEQELEVFPVPVVSAGPDRIILEGGIDSLFGSGSGNNIRYLWTPPTGLSSDTVARPKVLAKDDLTYTLTVTSEDGCSVSDQVFVSVLKAPSVPNVFTPNGDGINDRWEIKYLDTYPGATIEIFNRYGQVVFRSVGYSKAWDGSFNGRPLPAGTYYYIVNPKNGRRQIAGFVDIVR